MLEYSIRTSQHGYQPGWVLPSTHSLARQLATGVDTIKDAYRLLENLGLVTVKSRYGAVVRGEPRERRTITVPPGTVVTARMPALAEVDRWQLDPGIPMLEVDGQAWPADRYEIKVEGSETPPAQAG